MNLTREERKQAFAGTLKVLRRDAKPDQEAGDVVVLSQTRGGKQVVERDERKRQQLLDERKPITVEVPKQPNLWIVIKGWHLKQGSTEWETDVAIHDRREPTRMLAGGIATGLPREPGLKTRTHTPKPKGEKIESWNSETERGYGGGGRSSVDELAAVDDGTLNEFAAAVEEESAERRKCNHGRADTMRDKRKAAEETRRGNHSGARAARRRARRGEHRSAGE